MRLQWRRTALDLAILTSRRPGESPDDHAKGVPCWSEGVPYLQGSRPVIRSDSWPLEFAREFCRVVAAAGARPPAAGSDSAWPGSAFSPAIINYVRGTDMAARRTAKARTVTVNLNRSADVQQAPSSIHEGGRHSSPGQIKGAGDRVSGSWRHGPESTAAPKVPQRCANG